MKHLFRLSIFLYLFAFVTQNAFAQPTRIKLSQLQYSPDSSMIVLTDANGMQQYVTLDVLDSLLSQQCAHVDMSQTSPSGLTISDPTNEVEVQDWVDDYNSVNNCTAGTNFYIESCPAQNITIQSSVNTIDFLYSNGSSFTSYIDAADVQQAYQDYLDNVTNSQSSQNIADTLMYWLNIAGDYVTISNLQITNDNPATYNFDFKQNSYYISGVIGTLFNDTVFIDECNLYGNHVYETDINGNVLLIEEPAMPDDDNDPTNELDNTDEQTLSLNDNDLSISNGNTVELFLSTPNILTNAPKTIGDTTYPIGTPLETIIDAMVADALLDHMNEDQSMNNGSRLHTVNGRLQYRGSITGADGFDIISANGTTMFSVDF